jgi:hypothetical protein
MVCTALQIDVFDFSINFNSYNYGKFFKTKSGRPKDKRCADGELFGSIMRASRERQNRKGQVGKHNRYHQADE